ncbi:MAG: FHA domain-containing protein [Proteobacteria bacterium]|nr:FHA domain-containing protein [Pseudomonadota bacterium]
MTSILREIKRRRMIGTTVLYVLVCWGLIQVGDILTPTLGIDRDTFSRIFLYFALAGLPVTVVLSWFFQVTREGIVRTTPFHERRILSNIPTVDDRRPRQSAKSRNKRNPQDYSWVVTAENGPLAGFTYAITESILLGRSLDCDLAVMSPQMSRRHARLAIDGNTLTIEDLGSANGTRVNGQRVKGRHILCHGDTLQFQEIEFRVSESYDPARGKHSSMTQATVFKNGEEN